MIGRVRRAVAGVLLALALTGCAAFPDAGPREWQEKVEGAGELGGPPVVPEPGGSDEPQPPPADSDPSATAEPVGCDDPDLQVVATCLAPVSAVAVLPDARSALVAERTTGRVLRVQRDHAVDGLAEAGAGRDRLQALGDDRLDVVADEGL